MKGAPALFHGGPAVFEAPDPGRRHERSQLGALWFAADPFVASLYAGHDGWVQRASLDPSARILDASGGLGGAPVHWLSQDEMDRVEELREELGIEAPRDGLPLGSAFRHAWTCTGCAEDTGDPEYAPCWEGMLLDGDVPPFLLGELLRRMGWDAVLCSDETAGIVRDVEENLRDRAGSSPVRDADRTAEGNRLVLGCARALGAAAARVPVLAVLDPSVVRMHRGAVRGGSVMQGRMRGIPGPPATDLEALRRTCTPSGEPSPALGGIGPACT